MLALERNGNETHRWQIKPSFATSNNTTQHRDCSQFCITLTSLTIVDNTIPSLDQGVAQIIEILSRAASASLLSSLRHKHLA